MSHSYCESPELACPHCQTRFRPDVWLIVDTAERPDLVKRIRDATLHDVTCPRCRTTYTVDAPLLLYQPDRNPVVLFSPAENTQQEGDQLWLDVLVGLLREWLDTKWRDEWIAGGHSGIPRQYLSQMLDVDGATVGCPSLSGASEYPGLLQLRHVSAKTVGSRRDRNPARKWSDHGYRTTRSGVYQLQPHRQRMAGNPSDHAETIGPQQDHHGLGR